MGLPEYHEGDYLICAEWGWRALSVGELEKVVLGLGMFSGAGIEMARDAVGFDDEVTVSRPSLENVN